MVWKEAHARLHGHNPPSEDWHTGNTTTMLSSSEAQTVMNVEGVGVHWFAFGHGGLHTENAGHAVANHRWVHVTTGKWIKFSEYNAYVLFTVEKKN